MKRRANLLRAMTVAIAISVLVACGGASPTPTPTAPAAPTGSPSPASASTPASHTTPTASSTPTVVTSPATNSAPTTMPGSATSDALVYRLVPDQSEARYRAREQLLGRSLPNDAVGRTKSVQGQIVFRADGSIDPAQSRFTVDLATLQSDESRRDNYIKQNTLQVSRYPTATFQPTQATGLPWPLPTSGQVTFQLTGDLTIREMTKPVTWNVTATFDGQRVTGTATTQITFADFGLTKPQVPIVLSLEDTLVLELDFTMEPAP